LATVAQLNARRVMPGVSVLKVNMSLNSLFTGVGRKDVLRILDKGRAGTEQSRPPLPGTMPQFNLPVQLTREGWLADVSLPGASSSHAAARKKHPKASVPAG
jgi:hypothetical protein